MPDVIATVKPEDYAVNKLITRTIHIVIPGQAPTDIKQVASCYAHQIRDGQKITYEEWQKDSWSWKAYTPKAYFGYNCDVTEVPAVTVYHDTPNQTITVTYTAQAGLDNNYDHNDHGNYAWLDHYQLSGDQLQVSGWHATSDVKNKPYHYLIVFDNTTHSEVTRLMVRQTARPDIAVVHNVYGAGLAGFQTNLDLPAAVLQAGDHLSLISRYTDDQAGNGDATDYWFDLQMDQGNHGYLDVAQVQNGKLHVAGWHATNQAFGRDHHVLILFDASRGHEIARVNATNAERPDIAKIYPTVGNATMAGFVGDFDLTPELVTDNLQIISRYSSDADANSDYVDFWSAPRRLTTDTSNQGWLDDVSVRDGQLHIVGWHATDRSLGRKYHYIIIFDATPGIGHELRRFNITDQEVSRPDVAKAFPTIMTAGNSGFNISFANDPDFTEEHDLQIISRWTDDPAGNGNAVDYWFKPV